MLALVGAPLSVDKPPAALALATPGTGEHEAVPWAGLTSTVLSKGPISP